MMYSGTADNGFIRVLLVALTLAMLTGTANGQRGCRIMVNGMKKDYVFDYKRKRGAAFDDYEIRPFRLGSSKQPLKKYTMVDSVEQCFKKCIITKSCMSFTYFLGSCILWENHSLAADGSSGKSLAQFCESRGSIAGYVGYNPKESPEDKEEKKNCGGDHQSFLEECGAIATCNVGWTAVCDPAKGLLCTCG